MINELLRMQKAINELYPDMMTIFRVLPKHYELDVLTGLALITIEWKPDHHFGVSVITDENQWDRMFTYYNDIEFVDYDATFVQVLTLITHWTQNYR